MRERLYGWWVTARDPTPRFPADQLKAAIQQSNGNVTAAGRLLGASYRSVWVAIKLTPGATELLAAERRQAYLQRAVRDAEIFVRLHHGIPFGDGKGSQDQ
jgi:Bacterial regulatory protein, Fis family